MRKATKHLIYFFALLITVSVNAQWTFNPSSISTTMGNQTTASDYASLAIGQFNTDDTTPNPSSFSLENKAFIIGNGTDASNKSDAMTVLFDGTTTINGTTTISGHVIASVFSGESLEIGFENEASGQNSVAMGVHSRATGYSSTAMGSSFASGELSTTMGYLTTASGHNSVAMGEESRASGYSSTAMGGSTDANGAFSTAMGGSTNAIGEYSTAMGGGTNANGEFSTAMGNQSDAIGDSSTAMGVSTNAQGYASSTMGFLTTASDYASLVIGQLNTDDTTPNPTSFSLENKAFIIGNGTYSNKSDTMTVLFNGTTTIAGSMTATSFIGDGSLLTNLPSAPDNQQLLLNGNTLNLEDGGSADLSDFLDNTDNQNISGTALLGTVLTIGIERGTSEDIDLNPLLINLQAQIDAQQIIIDDLIARMKIQEDCKCKNNGGENGDNENEDSRVASDNAYLIYNVPNPFENSTSIGYFVPVISSNANIVISSSTGQILNNIKITKFGKGSIIVNKDRLDAATYYYTLYVDGEQIDTKRMIIK